MAKKYLDETGLARVKTNIDTKLSSKVDTTDSRLSDARTPKSHATSAITYGVGTTASYGHCKTINNLNQSSYTSGNALAAYQGYLLDQNKANTSDVDLNTYRLNISADTAKGATVTLPCTYKVGNDSLIVQLESETLIKATSSDTEGHYYEVGTSGSTSTQIRLTSDWNLSSGDILILRVKGVYA